MKRPSYVVLSISMFLLSFFLQEIIYFLLHHKYLNLTAQRAYHIFNGMPLMMVMAGCFFAAAWFAACLAVSRNFFQKTSFTGNYLLSCTGFGIVFTVLILILPSQDIVNVYTPDKIYKRDTDEVNLIHVSRTEYYFDWEDPYQPIRSTYTIGGCAYWRYDGYEARKSYKTADVIFRYCLSGDVNLLMSNTIKLPDNIQTYADEHIERFANKNDVGPDFVARRFSATELIELKQKTQDELSDPLGKAGLTFDDIYLD